MARRVHLHIGTMKSATTYLQDLCELHRDHLAEAGVLWPVGLIRYAGVRAFFGRPDDQIDPPAAWHSLASQISEFPGDVVLSNELLAGLESQRASRLVEALSPAAVRVVITARDAARVIPSAWQTAIRNGEKTYPWAEFSSAVCSDSTESVHESFWHQHDVARLVRRWRPLVDDRVTIVTVPPHGCEREAVARRFGMAIGVDLTNLAQPTSRSNSGLGAHSAELIRRVNLEIPGADRAARKFGIRNALADSALGPRAKLEPEFGLSHVQHAWVVEHAHRIVDELMAMGLVVEGDLTDLIPTSKPSAAVVDPGDSSDAELLDAAVDGLIGMARHTARLRVKGNHLRAEVERLTFERDRLLEAMQPNGSSGGRPARKVREIVRRIRS